MKRLVKIPGDMEEGCVHETKKYGNLVIVEYNSKYNVKIKFLDTGTECISNSLVIRRGESKDRFKPSVYGVGFIGGNDTDERSSGKSSSAYKAWQRMLERCYSEKYQDRNPTYKDCSVDPRWHNFQNFLSWYEINHVKGFHLDKDLKSKGNKVYSEDNCSYISCKDNNCYNVQRFHKLRV